MKHQWLLQQGNPIIQTSQTCFSIRFILFLIGIKDHLLETDFSSINTIAFTCNLIFVPKNRFHRDTSLCVIKSRLMFQCSVLVHFQSGRLCEALENSQLRMWVKVASRSYSNTGSGGKYSCSINTAALFMRFCLLRRLVRVPCIWKQN